MPSLRTMTLAVSLLACTAALAQQPPSLVRVDEVRSEPLSQTVEVIGRLVARQAGTVAARISGPVASFEVEIGDRVKVGSVLARLDDEALRLERAVANAGVAQARAKLETAKAQLGLAQQDSRRLERLKNTQATSKADYEDARQSELVAAAQVREAEAAIASAQASLNMRELELGRSVIRAPYDGVVTQRLIETGAYVQRGQDILRMLADTSLEIEADVPYERIGGLTTGTSVAVRLDDGSEHTATVRAVIPEENRLTRTRAVRFASDFGDYGAALAAGQSARVKVPLGARRDVLSVHKDAVTRRGPQSLVYVVVDDVAKLRPVQLGEAIGQRFVVLEGLTSGEVVVVRGNERLRPDEKVQVEVPTDAGTAATPPA